MGKIATDAVLDSMLDYIANHGTRMIVCSAQPSVYADLATYEIAQVNLTTGNGNGDYTEAEGDVSGRKLTTTQKSNISVDNSATATHIAIADTINTVLLVVTTCTSVALVSGNTVTIPAWKIEVSDPS